MSSAVSIEEATLRQKALEQLLLLLVIILQVWVFFGVPTDNNGDPNDYLLIARRLFSTGAPISFNRFIGYPLIIKILSLNLTHLNVLFFFQSTLFVAALVHFANAFALPSLLRCLLYLPGLIPSIAYLQKLIFPDGIILSLLLVFAAQLRKKNFFASGAITLILIAIKLVFVFVPAFLFAQWAIETKYFSKPKAYALFFVLLVCLVPIVYFIKPFPLYQTLVQVLIPADAGNAGTLPKILELSCGGEAKLVEVTDPAVLTRPSSDEFFMPLGEKTASDLGCTKDDVKKLQRRLILDTFLQDPFFELKKFSNHFVRAVFVFPQVAHVDHMLEEKYALALAHYNESFFYDDSQVRSWQEQKISPLVQPSLVLLGYSALYGDRYNGAIIKVILIVLLSPLIVWNYVKRPEFRSNANALLIFIVAYSFVISCFAFIYDRYVYVILFLWMAIIASSSRRKRLATNAAS